MRRNKMMRTAAVLGIAALLTTSALSGTLAKYTTSVNSEDSARVATWGFTESSIDLTGLFKTSYDNVDGTKAKVIAPGTTNNTKFSFTYGGQEAAPEVGYTFEVSTAGSECAQDIQSNTNIQWQLDNKGWKTWSEMLKDIEGLDGDKAEDTNKSTPANYYAPNTLPTEFGSKASNEHTVTWRWVFDETDTKGTQENKDTDDTKLGNKASLDSVKLKITITATQVD